jgi:hypothetical protein
MDQHHLKKTIDCMVTNPEKKQFSDRRIFGTNVFSFFPLIRN